MCLERERSAYESWRLDWLNAWGPIGMYASYQIYEQIQAVGGHSTFRYILSTDHNWQIFTSLDKDPVATIPKRES